MRQIGTIQSERDAKRFGDYLVARGIPCSVEEASQAWAVWVERDDDLEKARGELDGFLAHPTDTRYAGVTRQAERIRKSEEKRQVRLRRRFVDVRTRLGQPRQFGQPVTLVLMSLSLVLTILFWFGQRHGINVYYWLRFAAPEPEGMGGDVWQDLGRGQVWRLVTPVFIHGGGLHLLFNLFWLRDLGSMIETHRGTLVLLLLALAGALVGNFAQYYWIGPDFVGMSGVVYGLFGYVWMKSRYQPHQGLVIGQQTVQIMLIWLVVCMVIPGLNVANAAHVGGLAAGTAAGYAPTLRRRLRRSR
jgi:GlpG protein